MCFRSSTESAFDLGLYEAGTTKKVTFSREGVSYIFCNIHPEMSAVILVLSTPLYTTSGSDGSYSIHDVPPGEYELHVWVEGLTQPGLDRLRRRVQVTDSSGDLGVVDATGSTLESGEDTWNKFGQPYDTATSKPCLLEARHFTPRNRTPCRRYRFTLGRAWLRCAVVKS